MYKVFAQTHCYYEPTIHKGSIDCWLVVLRINVDIAIFQPYLDLEAGDNQSLKIQVARLGINPGPLSPQAKSLTHKGWNSLALLVETSRAYAIPRCLSVHPSVWPSICLAVCLSGRLSVCKQLLLPHLLWGYLSQRLLYSPSLLALWSSCTPAIVIMILSPGAQKGGVAIFPT